ncbi:RagB/SusD family nutrient uptake outer membrane protein [Croceitalea sp. P059]|uniref:RagB/SusD family nutrient uptake outer membrane protein n=1 Tax=Croceitalea sp. P059 TaxID=3075601 RepID=UPI002887D674|nr:RagB/SusD family nutrient uptake outer membrane protein [Croceitalea sp. P059]MDT0538311.1 RagB/SusD family nutrient uptake outer membrane protein [Croceitalea sp. P059]
MKKNSIKIYLMFSLCALVFASCTDLEIDETDSFISEGFQGLQDPASSLNSLYGNFGALGDQANTFALNEVTTDAFLIPTRGADWGDNGRWRKLHTHEWGLEETDILTPFQQWTSAQLLASRILDSRSNADASTAAQANFLRAYAMWMTLDLYGQVPFRDTQLPDSDLPTVLSGADAVNFIVADLDAAIAGLPTVSPGDMDNLRLASKASARFLKAKVLLNKHVYETQLSGGGGTAASGDMSEVISLVDAIAADGFALESMDYFEIFESSADTETIYWIQTGVGNRIFNGLHYNSTGLGGGGWNGFSTLAEYYDMFEGDANANEYDTDRNPISGQERRRGGVPKNGIPFSGAAGTSDNGGFEDGSNVGEGFLIGQQYALDGTALQDRQGAPLEFSREFVDGNGANSLINNSERTGIRLMKYSPRFDGGFSNTQIFFRYADAHLMKAEAMLRSGSDATAMVNELRTLRGATPLGTVSESDLLEERGRELFAEQVRRTDMIRFGQYLRDWEFKGTSEVGNQTRALFPIPLPQLLANPNLVQNPGY